MANVVPFEPKARAVGQLSPNELLENLVKTQTRFDTETGLVLEETWKAPDEVPAAVKSVATAKAMEMERTYLQRPTPDLITKWVVALGNLCRDPQGQANAEVTARAYISMLAKTELSRGCFSESSMERAVLKFPRWFPGYGELLAHLKEEQASLVKRYQRLEALLEAPDERDRVLDDQAVMSDEELLVQRHRVADFFAELHAAMDAARSGDNSRFDALKQKYPGGADADR